MMSPVTRGFEPFLCSVANKDIQKHTSMKHRVTLTNDGNNKSAKKYSKIQSAHLLESNFCMAAVTAMSFY